MATPNDNPSYDTLSRALHWGIAILVILAIALMELKGVFPKGSDPREGMKALHYQLGIALFGLMWLRLAWRSVKAAPVIVPTPQQWETLAAKAMHLALYAAMFALPILGVALLQAEGKPVDFLGVAFPAVVGEDKELAESLEEAHEVIGNLLIGMIAFHAVAALWHHLVRKDNTLARMLPGWLGRTTPR